MRRVAPHTFAEIYFSGCNPGFVESKDGVALVDAPQQAIDAMRFKERVLEHGPIRYLINTEHHGDHTWGNSFFPEVEVVGQLRLAGAFEEAWDSIGGFDERLERMKTPDDPWLGDVDSVWLVEQADLAPHPPSTVFDTELELKLGDHTIHCLHTPGHTAGQTAIHLPEEGVVFTGDNVFCRCRTWLHEADPWMWLASLEKIGALDASVIVPGHGEPCDMTYLTEQARVIRAWIDTIEGFVDRGLTEEAAVAENLDVRGQIDPHPMAQRLWVMEDSVTAANIRNIYGRVLAKRELGAAAS